MCDWFLTTPCSTLEKLLGPTQRNKIFLIRFEERGLILNMRRWRTLNGENRLKLRTIPGFAIVVTNEKLHLFIAVHEIVDRGGSNMKSARIVEFSL
jgi:hypothetical protein